MIMKMDLQPLNIGMIATKYQEIFQLDEDTALRMAKGTNGYPFAFQVLGYLCWKKKAMWTDVLPEYSQDLEEYVYEKLWSELSSNDWKVLIAMTEADDQKVGSIRAKAGTSSNRFGVYRDRLIKKGIVVAVEYGHFDFALPRFREFVCRMR